MEVFMQDKAYLIDFKKKKVFQTVFLESEL